MLANNPTSERAPRNKGVRSNCFGIASDVKRQHSGQGTPQALVGVSRKCVVSEETMRSLIVQHAYRACRRPLVSRRVAELLDDVMLTMVPFVDPKDLQLQSRA